MVAKVKEPQDEAVPKAKFGAGLDEIVKSRHQKLG